MSYTLVLNTPSRLAFEYAILISSLWATFWQLLYFARIGYVSFSTEQDRNQVIYKNDVLLLKAYNHEMVVVEVVGQ